MKVSVFGLGYVGCVSAACLASQGHRVVGVDTNSDKVEAINNGSSPIVEKGLDELIRRGRDTGNLRATQNANEATAHGDVLLICVGTPSDANGNLEFGFIDRVCTEIGHALRDASDRKVIAVRSTLIPGAIIQRVIPLLVRESGKNVGDGFSVASNPEFLREGSAIDDFNNPPFTVIGEVDTYAGERLMELYHHISAPVYRTDPDTASMVKYASNAFHGLKVVFANEIGRLSKKVGIDSTKVMEIFCQDSQLNISPRYLKPGFAFGGSCLPKDVRALVYLARHNDLQLPMLESILPSNRLHVQSVVDFILRDSGRTRVGIVGLSFKAGTDDLRESPMVELVETLSGKGLVVKIYDDNVTLSRLIGGNKAYIEQVLPHISAMMSNSMEDVIQKSDVIVVGHMLKDTKRQLLNLIGANQLVIDLVKLDLSDVSVPSEYEGVCW